MLDVNCTEYKKNMDMYMDKISESEPLLVTREHDENIVVLSEGKYNNMVENLYLMSNKTNYKWLMESKE